MFACCLSEETENVIEVNAGMVISPEVMDEEGAAAHDGNVPARRFRVRLQKPSPKAQLGWHLDTMHSEAMFVGGIVESRGLVHQHNEIALEGERILVNDYIVAVNGVSGDSLAIGEELKTAQVLDMTIQRPRRLFAACRKDGRELRMDLKHYPSGSGLLVHAIGDGVARAQMPELQVGDRIMRVNDVTGASSGLIEAISGADTLSLEVLRIH
mmetsp:Transcript_47000/g.132213  ORF Transcript_47000/g.132213 Transcript_47000/m.132213 type:complete len:212 (+) Transcript_47000:49-684(+)